MKKYEFETSSGTYKLNLTNLGAAHWGVKNRVRYGFYNPEGKRIFSGSDFHVPNHVDPESYDSAIALMGFLTLQDGDTDSEYFDKYTAAQWEFSESFDCEELKMVVFDYENKESE